MGSIHRGHGAHWSISKPGNLGPARQPEPRRQRKWRQRLRSWEKPWQPQPPMSGGWQQGLGQAHFSRVTAPTLRCFLYQPPLVRAQKQAPEAPGCSSNSPGKPKRHNGGSSARASPAGERGLGTRKRGGGGVMVHWNKTGLDRQEKKKIDADILMNPTPWNPSPSLPAPLPMPTVQLQLPLPPKRQACKFHFVLVMCAHSQPATSPSSHQHTPLKWPQLPSNKGKTLPRYSGEQPFPLFLQPLPQAPGSSKRLSRTASPPSPRPASPRRPLFSSDAHLLVSIPNLVFAAQAAAAWGGPLTPTEKNKTRRHPGAPRSVPIPASLPLRKKNPTLPPPHPLTCTARSL